MMRLESLSRLTSGAAPFLASSANFPKLPIRSALALLVSATAFGLAGCAQQPHYFAHAKEYFPSSRYGKASPRVVADGQPVPRGGGTYLVGHPYTVAGRTYYPSVNRHYSGVGLASWYGAAFHGRRTANGEIYDRDSITAAHPTMPLPSYARVTNLRNHFSMIVRVNDRGPFARGRIMDVSRRVADLLDFRRTGTTKVKVDYIGPASLAGSDDRKLVATLREDGRLAQLDMRHPPTLVADNDEPIRTASADIAPMPVVDDVADRGSVPVPLPPSEPMSFSGSMPLPPARPFDLGIAHSAGAHIGIHARFAKR
jgi:rare lipoprotein A